MHAVLVKNKSFPYDVMHKHGQILLFDSAALCSPLWYNNLSVTHKIIIYLTDVVEEQYNVQEWLRTYC